MTTVVHCKREPFDVYIGRPSKWGNPFPISATLNREQCIAAYHAWILSQPDLLKAISLELKNKVLGCWCHPKACHGDVLARIANEV